MKRLVMLLVSCTIIQALQDLRPGAIWNLRGNSIEWLDQTQGQPTDLEIANDISACQSTKAALVAQIQSDISTLNVSTNTAVQKLPALVDLLKQRGLLQ